MISGRRLTEALVPGVLNSLPHRLCALILLIGSCLSVSVFQCVAQVPKDKWERIFTGDESVIEVNKSSLTFLEDRLLRVSFRTLYKKQQNLPGQANTKYKSEIETTEVKLTGLSYRLVESTLFDDSGQVVVTRRAQLDEPWRAMKPGGMMEKLFGSVRSLAPFGYWKIVDLRYSVESGAISFERLRGTKVSLLPERADVGSQSCLGPHYVSESLTKEDISRRLGLTVDSLNLKAESIDAVVIKCTNAGWKTKQSMLLKLSDDVMLILWDGLFLELKRL